ncbi:MAG: PKD domain-containing protein, partial [Thermoplasmata archaeon]
MKFKSLAMIVLILLTMWAFNQGFLWNVIQNADGKDVRSADNDNTFGTATLISTQGYYNGTINGSDDFADIYKVYLNADASSGDLLNVNYTITNISAFGQVSIINPEKYTTAFRFWWTGVTSFDNITICASYSGYYYIAVASFGPIEQNYSLNVTWYSDTRTIDNDNTNATAQTAVSGGSYSGDLDPIYDYLDLYKIYLTSGATTSDGLILELHNWEDKALDLYNPDGSLRDNSDIIYSSDPNAKEVIEIVADQSGYYTIAVRSSIGFEPPGTPQNYYLNCTVVSGVPNDADYDRDSALLVFDGTEINSSFNSYFDKYDYYMIDLNADDNLTVSVFFIDGYGSVSVDIEDDIGYRINYIEYCSQIKGVWTWGIAEKSTRHYINLRQQDYQGNYTILFSLSGENLWDRDHPMTKNDINKDFSMLEDTEDLSHVNLNDIFIDRDSEIDFGSPSHPDGKGKNIDIDILYNGTVKFMPKDDFYGFEVVNFSATDIHSNSLYWEVNVTVININDPPQISTIGHLEWNEDEEVNYTIPIIDSDNTEFTITHNSTLFNEVNNTGRIAFTPTNEQVGYYYIHLEVSDGEYKTAVNFTAEVLNTNDPPQIIKVDNKPAVPEGYVELTAVEDSWYNFTIEASDPDHIIGETDILEFYTAETDSAFNIDSETGKVSFFPLQEHVGIFKTKIIVNDGKGGIGYQNLSINVENVNDNPTRPNIVINDKIDLTVYCSAEDAVDEDNDNLTYTWDFGDDSGKQTGKECYHSYSEEGIYNISVLVSDGAGGSSNAYYMLNVSLPPDDIPVDDGTDNNDSVIDDDFPKDDNVSDDNNIHPIIKKETDK